MVRRESLEVQSDNMEANLMIDYKNTKVIFVEKTYYTILQSFRAK